MPNEIFIPAMSGTGFKVRRGETIRVIDVEGEQIADFICFNMHNPREKLSTGETVGLNIAQHNADGTAIRSIYLTVGSKFYSNLHNPMFEITEDLAKGIHDLLFAPCSSASYALRFGEPQHKNCRDNLTGAVSAFGLDYLDIPDPINLFQNTRPGSDGVIETRAPVTKAGEYVTLKALMDCIVGVSACAFDKGPEGKRPNGAKCTPLKIQFMDRTS